LSGPEFRNDTYDDQDRLEEFTAGAEAFCGADNYLLEFSRGRPLGGPTYVGATAVCVKQPFGIAEYEERFRSAFPRKGVLFYEPVAEDLVWRIQSQEIPEGLDAYKEGDIYDDGITLSTFSTRQPDDAYQPPDYYETTEGPALNTGYRVPDYLPDATGDGTKSTTRP